jgi:hypothetical protein
MNLTLTIESLINGSLATLQSQDRAIAPMMMDATNTPVPIGVPSARSTFPVNVPTI